MQSIQYRRAVIICSGAIPSRGIICFGRRVWLVPPLRLVSSPEYPHAHWLLHFRCATQDASTTVALRREKREEKPVVLGRPSPLLCGDFEPCMLYGVLGCIEIDTRGDDALRSASRFLMRRICFNRTSLGLTNAFFENERCCPSACSIGRWRQGQTQPLACAPAISEGDGKGDQT